jgi:acetylornithine deacetylase/succinyl-diaminopimelate desuccinylase-like protein
MERMSDWKQYLDREQPRFVEEFLDFCRIPSISSLPEHAADVRRAARWVADRVAAAGMEHVEILETGGHPMVTADHLHAPGKPTVLIYGHFDTQPVDPLALWDADPFDPQVRDGRVVARGASDDKGGMFAPILAVEALLKTEGRFPSTSRSSSRGRRRSAARRWARSWRRTASASPATW